MTSRLRSRAAQVSIDANSNVKVQPGPGKVVEVGDTIQFANGLQLISLAVAITANVTLTSAPVGSLGFTSHATGRGKLFMADAGGKWQYAVVA
jgi:hypothetical protein